MTYTVKDHYFYAAKKLGLRARSAFKLLELQKKFHIVRRGDHVLDIGSAPGSFLQVLRDMVGHDGLLVGMDIQTMNPIEGIKIFQCDIFDEKIVRDCLSDRTFDVITSDLAPKTSGIKDLDQGRSVLLNQQVLKLEQFYLKKGGNMILKIFSGADFADFLRDVKKRFQKVTVFKPMSSRQSSRECFIVGFKKKFPLRPWEDFQD